MFDQTLLRSPTKIYLGDKNKMKNYICFFLILLASVNSSSASSDNNYDFVFKTNFVSNYIMHVYCVAGIGEFKDNEEYSHLYKNTIDSLDLIEIKKYESTLAFADGKTGPFTNFCFFLPAYLELKDEHEFEKYYSLLNNALKENNFREFFSTFAVNMDDPFLSNGLSMFLNMPDSIHEKFIKPMNPDFEKISRIFVNNISAYKNQVWEIAKKELDQKSEHLTKLFAGKQLIQKWEKFTGLSFSKDYHIFLLYANKRGPSANSLSLDKNSFYYNFTDEYFLDFISHEVGTHLIFPLVWKDQRTQKYQSIYQAAESLCQFYNKIILGKDSLAYTMEDYNYTEYEKFFRKHYIENIPHINLLIKSLEEMK